MVLCEIGMMIDRPGKRSYTNFIGGNSKFKGRFGYSWHYKDLQDKLILFSKCKNSLTKRDNNDNCEDFLNWNILNEKYSKIITDENLETTAKLCNLTIKSQEEQEKCFFSVIIDGKITRTQAFKKMDPINLNGDATTLITCTAISISMMCFQIDQKKSALSY